VAGRVKKQWRGVDNVARNIKAEWRGVDNVARQTFRGNVLFDGGSGDFVAASGYYTKTRIESDKAVIYADNNISGSSAMRFEATGLKSVKPISLNGYSKIRATFSGLSRNIFPTEHYVFINVTDKDETIGSWDECARLYNYTNNGGNSVYYWQSWVDFTVDFDIKTQLSGQNLDAWYVSVGMYTATMKNGGDVMYIKKLELIE
jgi:hypothetical protein